MKFRALADQTDGSALGRGEVSWSPPCSELGVGFAKRKWGRAQTAGLISCELLVGVHSPLAQP